jgi:hypothetical protein
VSKPNPNHHRTTRLIEKERIGGSELIRHHRRKHLSRRRCSYDVNRRADEGSSGATRFRSAKGIGNHFGDRVGRAHLNAVLADPLHDGDGTVARAIASPRTLHIGMVCWTIGMLLALMYFSIVYWLFRGKVSQHAEGYGH